MLVKVATGVIQGSVVKPQVSVETGCQVDILLFENTAY